MRTVESFKHSVTDVNQNLEKPCYGKAEGISAEVTGFHETAK